MGSEYLKDRSGRTIGRIEDRTQEQILYDATGRRAGRYDKKTNRTFDASGRTAGTGNSLTALLVRLP